MRQTLGKWLKKSLSKKGFTQQKLADRAGLSRVLVNQIINEKTLKVTPETLAKLTGALRLIPPDHIVESAIQDRRRERAAKAGKGEEDNFDLWAAWSSAAEESLRAQREEEAEDADWDIGEIRLKRDVPEADLEDPDTLPHNVESVDDAIAAIVASGELGRPDVQVVRILGDSRWQDIWPGDFIVLSPHAPCVNGMLALVEIQTPAHGPWRVLGYVTDRDDGYEIQPLCSKPYMLIPYHHAAAFTPAIGHIAVRRIEPPRGVRSLRIITPPITLSSRKRRKTPRKKE